MPNDSVTDPNNPLSGYFTPYTAEAAALDAANAARNSSGIRYVQLSKLPPGNYTFRVLPAKPGRKSPFYVRYAHFVKSGDKTRVVECARLMLGARCLACEHIDALEATLNPTDAAIAKEMRPEFSVQFAALDCGLPVDPADPCAVICVVEAKKTVHTDLLGMRQNAQNGGDLTDPIGGFGICVVKTGAGKGTEYKTQPSLRLGGGILGGSMANAIAILKGMPDIWGATRQTDAEIEEIMAGAGLVGAPAAPGAPTAGGAVQQNFGPRR